MILLLLTYLTNNIINIIFNIIIITDNIIINNNNINNNNINNTHNKNSNKIGRIVDGSHVDAMCPMIVIERVFSL